MSILRIMTSATPRASSESVFSGCVCVLRSPSTSTGATEYTGTPASTRNPESRSPQLCTSSSPKHGERPFLRAVDAACSMSEAKSLSRLPIVISNMVSPNGERAIAVWVSLCTSTPTNRIARRSMVCMTTRLIMLIIRAPHDGPVCASQPPSGATNPLSGQAGAQQKRGAISRWPASHMRAAGFGDAIPHLCCAC